MTLTVCDAQVTSEVCRYGISLGVCRSSLSAYQLSDLGKEHFLYLHSAKPKCLASWVYNTSSFVLNNQEKPRKWEISVLPNCFCSERRTEGLSMKPWPIPVSNNIGVVVICAEDSVPLICGLSLNWGEVILILVGWGRSLNAGGTSTPASVLTLDTSTKRSQGWLRK